MFNVTRVVTLSRHNTELSARADADRAEAQRLIGEAARIRKTINKDELALVVAAAQEANVLIDQRTFSWTEFFNQIESTLPPDVMLTSVRPSFKKGVTHVAMSVLAREAPDLEEFMDKLEATGSFSHVVLASEDSTDEGLFRALIETDYARPDRADAGRQATRRIRQRGYPAPRVVREHLRHLRGRQRSLSPGEDVSEYRPARARRKAQVDRAGRRRIAGQRGALRDRRVSALEKSCGR